MLKRQLMPPPGLWMLPHELISEIFLLCLPQVASLSKNAAPLLLSHICKHWRNASLSIPQLWSTIRVPCWNHLPHEPGPLLQLWLDRSAQLHLSIHIDVIDDDVQIVPYEDDDVKYQNLLRDIVEMLAPHRQRIRRFRGVLPELLHPEAGFEEMYNLEEFRYCGMYLSWSPPSQPLQLPAQKTPLKTLSLCRVHVDLGTVLHQTQLTRLELVDIEHVEDLTPGLVLNILKCLPLLQTFAVNVVLQDKESVPAAEEPINLVALKQLYVTWTYPADIGPLLDCICAPNLQRFGLRGTPRTDHESWPHLKKFIGRSAAPLTHLSLGDLGDVEVELLECLKLCPGLTHLTVNHGPVDEVLLLDLECHPGRLSLVPKLEYLSIGACNSFESPDLCSMLKTRGKHSRHSENGSLREIRTMYCRGVCGCDWDAIVACGVEEVVIDSARSFAEVPLQRGLQPFARVIESHKAFFAT